MNPHTGPLCCFRPGGLKEEEVAKRIADTLAAREAAWAEREANMQALLNERELAARAAQAEVAAAVAEARGATLAAQKASQAAQV